MSEPHPGGACRRAPDQHGEPGRPAANVVVPEPFETRARLERSAIIQRMTPLFVGVTARTAFDLSGVADAPSKRQRALTISRDG